MSCLDLARVEVASAPPAEVHLGAPHPVSCFSGHIDVLALVAQQVM